MWVTSRHPLAAGHGSPRTPCAQDAGCAAAPNGDGCADRTRCCGRAARHVTPKCRAATFFTRVGPMASAPRTRRCLTVRAHRGRRRPGGCRCSGRVGLPEPDSPGQRVPPASDCPTRSHPQPMKVVCPSLRLLGMTDRKPEVTAAGFARLVKPGQSTVEVEVPTSVAG